MITATRRCLLLIALLLSLACTPRAAVAAPSSVRLADGSTASSGPTIQVPSQVVLQQAFSVQVSVPGAADGQTATLSMVDADANGGAPLTLSGTVQAATTKGVAIFPAVVVAGNLTAARSIRLAAVLVDGTRTRSGVSAPIGVNVAPPPPAIGIVGLGLSLDKGKLTVDQTLEGMPASQAGVKAGDVIVAIDGHPVDTTSLDAAIHGLSGSAGSTVLVTVQHKGSSKTDVLSMTRAASAISSISFKAIPSQMNEGLFQISVSAVDASGRPLVGANVTVTLDKSYTSAHALFFSSKINLRDASGTFVNAVTGVTGADGVAPIWIRLGTNITPFKARLAATIRVGQQTLGPIQSNVFTVYDPDE